MIFYFSGTGNSKWVATQLAEHFSDTLIQIGEYERIDATLSPQFEIKSDEKIGFVFPIHSWGMPPIVAKFIADLQLKGYFNQLIYCVMTCGDECGSADKLFTKAIKSKGFDSKHIYSLVMPNNYICMKGFDTDSKDVEEEKKQQAVTDLPQIISAIENDRPIDFYHKGTFAPIKTGIIFKLFANFALSDKAFYSNENCNSCGKCVKVCPVGNIELIDGKPHWKGDCTQCLACIHYCPTQAIEYGKSTKGKGRYTFK